MPHSLIVAISENRVIGRAGGVATWAFAVDDEALAREVLGLPAARPEPEAARS